MEMTGEQLIPIPQAEVWRALNDPEVLKACIAGCETIERVSDTEYRVAMVAAVGPVKAKFNGKLVLSDLNPPNSYSLSFEGSGGAAGFGKGGAQVSLKPEGNGTRLSYTAKASVGGFPAAFFWCVAVSLIASVLLYKSRFGLRVFAIGAILSGAAGFIGMYVSVRANVRTSR